MRPIRTQSLELKPDHGWTSEPGCKVFVADGGAVRFDFPQQWVIEAGENQAIHLLDRPSPDHTCLLEITRFFLRDELDFSGVTPSRIVRQVLSDSDRNNSSGEALVVEESHGDLKVAWASTRKEFRSTSGRLTVLAARRWNIQAIFRFRHLENPTSEVSAFWAILLKTLVLGDYVEDPTQRIP